MEITIFGFSISVSILWVVVFLLAAVVEALTMNLVTIWFAAGGLVAFILSLFDTPFWMQIAVFIIFSLILLIFSKKIFRNKLKVGQEKTNVESLIGEVAIVKEEIKPFATGQVKVNGQVWTAQSEKNDMVFEKGTVVRIKKIEGVKLIVSEE